MARVPTPPAGPPRRFGRGFQQAGRLVAPQVAGAARRKGFSEPRLLTDWAAIAGPALALICRPVRMSRARGPRAEAVGGTLTIAVDGARAPEVQMMLPTLRERVNAALGFTAVSRIQVIQGWGFAEAAEPFERATPPAPPPDPATLDPLLGTVSSIGDDGLRDALETLARNVVSGGRTRP